MCAPRQPGPRFPSWPSPVRCLYCCAIPRPRAFPARMPPASYARLMTRQSASAFNQPLSFDMFSVTEDINYMFNVRTAQARPPLPIQALACTLPLHALAPPCLHAARF